MRDPLHIACDGLSAVVHIVLPPVLTFLPSTAQVSGFRDPLA